MPLENDPPAPAVGGDVPIGKLARSLPALVAEHLTKEILSGAIAPGTRLTEVALAEQHSVSRATVREAFSIVEKARLVERIPRYGAQVVDIRIDEIQEISEVRGVLLGLAVQRAIGFDDAAEIAAFRTTIEEMDEMAQRESATPEEFAACALRAQRQLLGMARSRTLTESYEQLSHFSLWNAVIRSRSTTFVTAQRRLESARNWMRLVECIEARDAVRGDAAARAMLADVARFMGRLLKPKDEPATPAKAAAPLTR